MVKILSNGEIVADDDPRARGLSGSKPSRNQQTKKRQGFIRQENVAQNQGGFGFGGNTGGGGGNQVSIFQILNQKLLDLGIPRFNIGPYSVDPIASVGFVLSGLMFGLPGMGFAALLFIIVKTSQGTEDSTRDNRGSSGGGGGRGGFQGGGQRLGRS